VIGRAVIEAMQTDADRFPHLPATRARDFQNPRGLIIETRLHLSADQQGDIAIGGADDNK
jgi:hypothetical protein